MVRGNTVFENYGSGIQLNADVTQGGDGIISNAVIENNVLRANGAGGGASINLDGVQDSDIRNNLIEDARATGIALFRQNGATGSMNDRIVNNTVVVDNLLNPASGRWALSISGGSTGTVLKNNILFSTQSFRGAVSVAPDSLAGLVSDYNAVEDRLSIDDGNTALGLAAWRTATGQDSHSLSLADLTSLNNLFVNRASGDYHLAMTSAAIDRGSSVGAPSTDFEGQVAPVRAGYDIGADEYAQRSLAHILYSDTFSGSGLNSAWKVTGGSWSVANGVGSQTFDHIGRPQEIRPHRCINASGGRGRGSGSCRFLAIGRLGPCWDWSYTNASGSRIQPALPR